MLSDCDHSAQSYVRGVVVSAFACGFARENYETMTSAFFEELMQTSFCAPVLSGAIGLDETTRFMKRQRRVYSRVQV